MSDVREQAIRNFLDQNGWRGIDAAPLAGDASNRRYMRMRHGERRAVLMDAPGPEESVHPFVAMTEWLIGGGYSAPRILAADTEAGFLLLEDLGDDLYSRWLVQRPDDEAMLYRRAVDLLADLSERPVPEMIGARPSSVTVAPYDREVLGREAMLTPEWWMPVAQGRNISGQQRDDYLGLIRTATAEVAGSRRVMVLRDYHADNLLWLPDRAGVAAVGLLDYQDVLAGHPAYDLVSLLEDARRDTTPELREAMIARYLAQRPGEDADAFRHAYAVLGAQRNLKIVGIFARLAIRDRKPAYLQMIPRVWAHLQHDLEHPALAELRSWVMRNVPPPEPSCLAAVMAEAVS